MVRHASGVFVRKDLVRVHAGATVRVVAGQRKPAVKARLIGLGTSELVLTSPQALLLGAPVSVAITLPGRYIEFEVPGVVEWEKGATFGIRFDYLSARQAYGIELAREVLRAPEPAPASNRLARG